MSLCSYEAKLRFLKRGLGMKKYIFIIVCILCLGTVSGCKKAKVFEFEKEDVQSLFVYTYNFTSNQTTSNWAYKEADMKDFLGYLENLSGTKIDTIDIESLSGPFYGVELNAENSYNILFAGDYAIMYKGEFYRIDGKEAVEMCQSIVGDTRINDHVLNIVNHRYLSLIEGHWDTRYMTITNYKEEEMENVQLVGVMTSVELDVEMLAFTMVNNSGRTIEFGSRLVLETLLNDEWYNIDNMIIDNVNLAWTDLLYRLESGESIESKFFINHYQPLPTGKYRLIKEVDDDNKVSYVAYEFNIEE